MIPVISPPRVRVHRSRLSLGWAWSCSCCGHAGYFSLTQADAYRDGEAHYIRSHVYGDPKTATASILEELFGEWGW